MAANEVIPGPAMLNVIANVKRRREELRLSQAQLSDKLTDVGRPIRATGLHRLETGKRRVDVDDLVGLALALEVSPITLLLPWRATGDVQLTESIVVDALTAWDWARGLRPVEAPEDAEEAAYVTTRFRMFTTPSGARIGELRPGTPEFEERLERQARDMERKGIGGRGKHPEAP